MNTNKTSLVFTTSTVTPAFRRILKNTSSIHVGRICESKGCTEVVCYHPLFGGISKSNCFVHWEVGCYYSRRLRTWFWARLQYNEATNCLEERLEGVLTASEVQLYVDEVKNHGGPLPCGTVPCHL